MDTDATSTTTVVFTINLFKLLTNENKLSSILYQIMFNLKDDHTFKWMDYIKSLLDNAGLSYVWTQQSPLDINQLKIILTEKLRFIHSTIA